MSTTRYNPRVRQSTFGFSGAVMTPDEHGCYVTYASHREEVESLQSELDALKSMQNHQNSDDAIANINAAVATCVKTELERFFKQAAEKTFKVEIDPARDLAKEWSDALSRSHGSTICADLRVRPEHFRIAVVNPVDAQPPKQYYAKCIYQRGTTSFTFGKEYFCEPSDDLSYINILSDDYVGDLACGDGWTATIMRDGVYDAFGDSQEFSAMFELIQK